MAYIQRQLQESVLQLSDRYPVVLVAGPRGAGKTAMLRMLMDVENMLPRGAMSDSGTQGKRIRCFVSLDDLRERDLARRDPGMFLKQHRPPVLIAEAQYAPELFPAIRDHIRQGGSNGDFWMTGSHLYDLMDAVQAWLPDCLAVLNLFPLSGSELDGVEAVPFLPQREMLEGGCPTSVTMEDVYFRIWRGGMPKLCSGRSEDWKYYYSRYLNSIVMRDVRDLNGGTDALKFLKFLSAAAERVGQVLNVRGIAEAAEIDQITAKNWLSILADLGLIYYLHPFEDPALKRTLKAPKLYFHDTGLACYLLCLDAPEFLQDTAISEALFENYAVSEVMRSYCCIGYTPKMYYYRDRDSAEISLLLKEGEVLYPIQIRRTDAPTRRMVSAFAILEKNGITLGQGAILCMTDRVEVLKNGVLTVPVSQI